MTIEAAALMFESSVACGITELWYHSFTYLGAVVMCIIFVFVPGCNCSFIVTFALHLLLYSELNLILGLILCSVVKFHFVHITMVARQCTQA